MSIHNICSLSSSGLASKSSKASSLWSPEKSSASSLRWFSCGSMAHAMMGSIKTHATQNRHHTSVFYPYIHIMYLGINVQHIYEECIWEYTWVMTKKGKRVRSKMSWLSSSRLHQSSKSSLLWWKSFSCSYQKTGLKSRSLQKLFNGRLNCWGQLKLTEHPPLRWGGQEQLGWQCSLVRAPDCGNKSANINNSAIDGIPLRLMEIHNAS